MHFRKHLTEDSVFLDEDFRDLAEVLTFLSRRFAEQTGLAEETVRSLLEEREELSATWIGNGTMLPHNHTPLVKDLHMVFIRCQTPFISAEGHEVRYVVSILTSGEQEQLYLGILQGIGRLLKEQREELDRCRAPGEFFQLLVSSSQRMGQPLTAGDLARPWPRVRKEDSLATALDLMKQQEVYFLPVFSGESEKLCGVLDLVDLLKAGFPDYVFSLSNLSMIKDFQPVKYFWQSENNLIIGDFIRDYRPYMIREEASYPEIFFMMIKGSRRHLLVLNRRDELIGVIHPHEIINTMLRP